MGSLLNPLLRAHEKVPNDYAHMLPYQLGHLYSMSLWANRKVKANILRSWLQHEICVESSAVFTTSFKLSEGQIHYRILAKMSKEIK